MPEIETVASFAIVFGCRLPGPGTNASCRRRKHSRAMCAGVGASRTTELSVVLEASTYPGCRPIRWLCRRSPPVAETERVFTRTDMAGTAVSPGGFERGDAPSPTTLRPGTGLNV